MESSNTGKRKREDGECSKVLSQGETSGTTHTSNDHSRHARSVRKKIMLSQKWRMRGTRIDGKMYFYYVSPNRRPNTHLQIRPCKSFDCGCERCHDYVKAKNARAMRRALILSKRLTKKIADLLAAQNPILECSNCKALVWHSEQTGYDSRREIPLFTICCQQGRVSLTPVRPTPPYLENLRDTSVAYRNNERVYNSLLAFTSLGANIDHSVSSGKGPPTFRIRGQIYHRIGSLIPTPGKPPKFMQMWIVDTENEVANRLKTMTRRNSNDQLEEQVVLGLITMLDELNCLCKFFRKARDRYKENDLEEITVRLIGRKEKGRQYDLPEINEVAGLIVGDIQTTTGYRDVVLELQSNHLQQISDDHPLFMSLQYPLLFPHGEYGYHPEIPHALTQIGERKRTFISPREYYAYQIQTRHSEGKTIINGGRLLHQYVVDAYTAVEQERLQWARNNQEQLRADLYKNVFDAVGKGEVEGNKLGKRYILPSSFTGGPRYMVEKYHDAMAICREYGNPHLFITFTANPNWKEIKDHLSSYGGRSGNERPDIESRVFKMKLNEFYTDLEKGTFFNPCIAALYTIEFQKRGLPHAHMLLWLDNTPKHPSPSDVNRIISAELPSKATDPEGFALVEKHMMHGPCGTDNLKSPCMDKRVCTKKFPRRYSEQTTVDNSGYIIYRRRQNEVDLALKGRIKLNNRYVVPHNLSILKKYEAHINVEWCNTTNAVKYLFKYITKGVDKATILIEKGTQKSGESKGKEKVSHERNEIQEYLDCRYLSPCEAMWRTFAFSIHKRKPSVQKLALHLPNQQTITYKDSDDLERVISRYGIEKTMMTEWFVMNRKSELARSLTFVEFPKYFVWDYKNKEWRLRKQGNSIGRIVNIHPSSGDLYFLKVLVNVVVGPKSFKDLITVNGVLQASFKAACFARGLLDDDFEWRRAMGEFDRWAHPIHLRHLFVTMLIYCEVADPLGLWEHCWRSLAADILKKKQREFGFLTYTVDDEELQQYTLIEVEKILHQYDRSITDFTGLPTPELAILKELGNSLLDQESKYNVKEEKETHDANYLLLNVDQRNVYHAVLNSVDNNLGKLFFLNGPGGTGKTFVYKTIMAKLRSTKRVVLPVASSGIAALLLPGGRTAHSRFKIPLDPDEEAVCEIKKGTMLSELIFEAKLIIWDEAPMAHRHAFEAVDRTLKDLMSTDDPLASSKVFGGKTVLLGGDFRQILPVITRGTRADTVLAAINQSYIWDECTFFVLKRNMRLQPSQAEFAKWLLSVGEGTTLTGTTSKDGEKADGESIGVDKSFMLANIGNPLQQILYHAYTTADSLLGTHADLTKRAILTPRNETVDEINDFMLSQAKGEIKEYLSYDYIGASDTAGPDYDALYPSEYLNSLDYPGLPKHKLKLKLGVIVMLLRNINQKEGLCNGTRLIITHLGERVIGAEIATEPHVGKQVILPRIIFSPSLSDHPFTLKRRQFPVRVCYAMTINKSQGQSLQAVLLYLPKPVFTHGQLYVALSRVTSPSGLAILQEEDQDCQVTNIVYKEVFNNVPN